MAKKANIDDAVSLFPFLSILAAVIGILVLMITAITLGQVGKDNPQAQADAAAAAQAEEEAKARTVDYKRLREQAKSDAEAIKQLESALAQVAIAERDAATRAANIAAAKKELAELQAAAKQNSAAAEQRTTELAEKTARLAQLLQENKELDERLKPLLEQLAKLREQVAKLKAPPEEAQVQVKPSGSGSSLTPTFVECAVESIVLHDRAQPLRIPKAQLGSHAEFLKLLDKVRDTPQSTVVFLIRPDGVSTYTSARNVARGRSVSNGKLAIGSQGKLDLTLFQKK
jgi:ABC-type transporter Mla subunit MlaD